MTTIRAAVGRGAPNHPDDVTAIQRLLVRHARWLDGAPPPEVNGQYDAATARAILGFQKDGAALAVPDGVVSPRGGTLARLALDQIAGPQHRIFRSLCWAHQGDTLTEADFATVATTLGCEVAAIKAVADTEAKDEPWDMMGRPIILFERHKFAKHSHGLYNRSHPDISTPRAGGYGPSSRQYDRLRRAAMLDETAALKSASWGLFQIMGENHGDAGHPTVAAFVDAMMLRRSEHLKAFAHFVAANPGMKKAIQNRDWATFARAYNGPDYATNDYDGKMRRAYERFAPATPAPARQPAGVR